MFTKLKINELESNNLIRIIIFHIGFYMVKKIILRNFGIQNCEYIYKVTDFCIKHRKITEKN